MKSQNSLNWQSNFDLKRMLGDSHYPILRLAIILAKGDTQINELNSPDIEANK